MNRFTTFEGVFTPCLLSILGVIMYLRLGWVVGTAGLSAALLIIVIANLITLATALSMSSIVTNIRIGAGGAHSIIAKSLGVELGGAIGLPLYLSQAISVAFYITGFAECWVYVFPTHSMLAVALVAWFAVLMISYLSARLAFRLQYGILVMIAVSLVSIFLMKHDIAPTATGWYGMKTGGFWKGFAIFFPAVTGILAGASMSGELKDSKRSIPVGTLSAIGVSFVVYVILAIWFGLNASADDLVNNKALILDLARWKWPVILGIMGATLSSALSMSVGSPRTLLALGRHHIVPFSRSFARLNKRGEPTAGVLLTALVSLVALLFGTLDSVAELLTMIFLMTYGIINLVVFIEEAIGIASFRPTFRIPRLIPLFGAVACFATMWLLHMQFSLIAIALLVIIYIVLVRRQIQIHSPDVRSGILQFMAEQFAKAAARLPYHPKIWKPNLLVPVKDSTDLTGACPLIESIVSPSGRIIVYRTMDRQPAIPDHGDSPEDEGVKAAREELQEVVKPMRERGLFVEASVIESKDFFDSVISMLQMLKGSFFPPNTLFYLLPESSHDDGHLVLLLKKMSQEGLGIVLFRKPDDIIFRGEGTVNLWIRQRTPNIDLSILVALQLKENWEGRLRLLQAVATADDVQEARKYMERIVQIMRLPQDVELVVLVGQFKDVLPNSPEGSINIFGMPKDPDLSLVRSVYQDINTPVLFIKDSAYESAIA